MSRWNVTIKSALLATAALMVVGALATADAAPDPAERYRAVQITEEDVILQDPQIQAVLQNQDFHRMLLEGNLGEALERSGYLRDPSAPGDGGILPWNFDSARDEALHQAFRLPALGLNRTVPGMRPVAVVQHPSFR
jgi:hypothetical protein